MLGYNCSMTTINTIEDLARILKEQPTWAEAIRALVLSGDLLDLPARVDKFIEEQRQFNAAQRQFNEEQRQFNAAQLQFNEEQRQFNAAQLQFNEEQRQINSRFSQRFDSIEGRLGNLEGGQYERSVKFKAVSRAILALGFSSPYLALTQDSNADPRLARAINMAVASGVMTRERLVGIYEADLIISASDNRHAVFEVSITADNGDIRRAKERAEILEEITGGEVTPSVITSTLYEPQRQYAEAENVAVFVIPYP